MLRSCASLPILASFPSILKRYQVARQILDSAVRQNVSNTVSRPIPSKSGLMVSIAPSSMPEGGGVAPVGAVKNSADEESRRSSTDSARADGEPRRVETIASDAEKTDGSGSNDKAMSDTGASEDDRHTVDQTGGVVESEDYVEEDINDKTGEQREHEQQQQDEEVEIPLVMPSTAGVPGDDEPHVATGDAGKRSGGLPGTERIGDMREAPEDRPLSETEGTSDAERHDSEDGAAEASDVPRTHSAAVLVAVDPVACPDAGSREAEGHTHKEEGLENADEGHGGAPPEENSTLQDAPAATDGDIVNGKACAGTGESTQERTGLRPVEDRDGDDVDVAGHVGNAP